MRLLKSQKNQLFDIIEEKGLSPAQFKFEEIVDDSGFILVKKTHLQYDESEFYFIFDLDKRFNSRLVQYSPAETIIETETSCENWNEQLYYFRKWLTNIIREISIEDKWERLQSELQNVNLSYEDSTDKFTAQEYEVLKGQIEALKSRISELELSSEQIHHINTKLDHLTEYAKTLNKTDWKSLFIGTVVNTTMTLGLEQDTAVQIWEAIKEIFQTYFLTS
jgi:hypothetical protein